jgi:NADH-quinone oxidoreductase subunit H
MDAIQEWLGTETGFQTAASLVKVLVIANSLLGVVALMTWIERRLSAIMQFRVGPNRVGPAGLFQPVADGIKFIGKQDIIPRDAYKPLFVLAPLMSLVPAVVAFSAIPIGPTIEVFGHRVNLVINDWSAGILFVLAITSLGVYGIVMAGWASRSKYSLIGGLRSSAQMVSYELALGISLMGVLMISGTLRPTEIVELQGGWFWNWNAFTGGWQLVGFLVFLVAIFAETNRLPFDMPEAESELVAGYHTEYSAMKFSMFFMAEYVNMITGAAMAVTLFLGGWQVGLPLEAWGISGWPLWIAQIAAFAAKVGLFLILFVWVRWTLPRFRYDQLMALGWKRMFPLALANIILTAILVAFR